MRALLAATVPLLLSAAPVAQTQCSKPIPVPPTVTTPNSTYYTDVDPPARFSKPPTAPLRITFGQQAIDKLCGKPPCGMTLEGCEDGDQMALPDPFSTDPETFSRIIKHELGHVNGWPATHGD